MWFCQFIFLINQSVYRGFLHMHMRSPQSCRDYLPWIWEKTSSTAAPTATTGTIGGTTATTQDFHNLLYSSFTFGCTSAMLRKRWPTLECVWKWSEIVGHTNSLTDFISQPSKSAVTFTLQKVFHSWTWIQFLDLDFFLPLICIEGVWTVKVQTITNPKLKNGFEVHNVKLWPIGESFVPLAKFYSIFVV